MYFRYVENTSYAAGLAGGKPVENISKKIIDFQVTLTVKV